MNVFIEILEFPLCIKNKMLKIKDITKLNIENIAGKNLGFNNSNLGPKEPHKIIISNDNEKITLSYYDNDINLYDEELSRTITINKLTNIIDYLLKENQKNLALIFSFIYKDLGVILLFFFQNITLLSINA